VALKNWNEDEAIALLKEFVPKGEAGVVVTVVGAAPKKYIVVLGKDDAANMPAFVTTAKGNADDEVTRIRGTAGSEAKDWDKDKYAVMLKRAVGGGANSRYCVVALFGPNTSGTDAQAIAKRKRKVKKMFEQFSSDLDDADDVRRP